MNLNRAQTRLLANFCSEMAKGALLSGLGFAFVVPGEPVARAVFTVSALLFAGSALFLALEFAKMIKEAQNEQ
jgi:hypothetical protein